MRLIQRSPFRSRQRLEHFKQWIEPTGERAAILQMWHCWACRPANRRIQGGASQFGVELQLMKTKSAKAISFVNDLHDFIVTDPQFRKNTATRTETQIQTEIRPLIIRYLENYFSALGYSDAVAKANKSFYWEGQEGSFGKVRETTFGSRNYPDFIIKEPYAVAVEYKQSPNGSTVKHGVGQSMMHTLSGDFDFVYFLFHDQSKDKRIEQSAKGKSESAIIERMWDDFNVLIRFV